MRGLLTAGLAGLMICHAPNSVAYDASSHVPPLYAQAIPLHERRNPSIEDVNRKDNLLYIIGHLLKKTAASADPNDTSNVRILEDSFEAECKAGGREHNHTFGIRIDLNMLGWEAYDKLGRQGSNLRGIVESVFLYSDEIFAQYNYVHDDYTVTMFLRPYHITNGNRNNPIVISSRTLAPNSRNPSESRLRSRVATLHLAVLRAALEKYSHNNVTPMTMEQYEAALKEAKASLLGIST